MSESKINEVVVAEVVITSDNQEETKEEENPIENELVNILVEKLGEKLKENNIDIGIDSIPNIVRYGMEIVEAYNGNIDNKKEMVIDMIKIIIKMTDIDEDKKNIALEMLESDFVDSLIELIIQASKGQLEINQETIEDIVEVTEGCCFTLFKCLKL